MGFAYAHKGKLINRKGFFVFEQFVEALRAAPEEAPAIIHFRMASHGAINVENCHPFWVNNDYAMIHNGCIPGFGTQFLSDTNCFVKDILRPLFNQIGNKITLNDPRQNYHLRYLIASAVGMSKIIFLRSDGQHMIVGEGKGSLIGGSWYSNEHSIRPIPPPEPEVVKKKKKGAKGSSTARTFTTFSSLPAIKINNGLPEGASRAMSLGHHQPSPDIVKAAYSGPAVGDLVGSAM
jgi:hypothetical protein